MSLTFPVLLVQKYLELNGYFVHLNFNVHDVCSGSSVRTDIDVIAVRFPFSFEKPIGVRRCFEHHELLVPKKNIIDIIIGEIKEGRVNGKIDHFEDYDVLLYALNRIGLFDEKQTKN